jgi:hypothetical protein
MEKEKSISDDLYLEEKTQEISLQQEIKQRNEPICVQTVGWETIYLPFKEVIRSIATWFMLQRNEAHFDNPSSKPQEVSANSLVFYYIQGRKAIPCVLSSWSPLVKQIQTFLQQQDLDWACAYEWPIDGHIDETFKNALLSYYSSLEQSAFTEYYINKKQEIRFFHNPSSGGKLTYSLGVTLCPYETEEEIFLYTQQPSSFWSSDFFCNYINTKTEDTEHTEMLIDPQTWNQYYNYPSSSIEVTWSKHWNIQRFLIQPHYQNVWLSKEQARINVVYDLFKYYLFFYQGNKDLAKQASKKLMISYVDPIVNSYFEERYHANYKVFSQWYWPSVPKSKPSRENFSSPLNLFSNDTDDNWFVENILSYNSDNPWSEYSKQEIEWVLIDYNIHVRRKSPDEAKTIVTNLFQKYASKIDENMEFCRKTQHTDELKRLQKRKSFFTS